MSTWLYRCGTTSPGYTQVITRPGRDILHDPRSLGELTQGVTTEVQDSDVVILLHRQDAYERASPRAGKADLIVAKHRNGPTATVTVAFQGHLAVECAHAGSPDASVMISMRWPSGSRK